MRGLEGAFERSWSGARGTVPWTQALLPLAGAYALGSAAARARARSRRRGIPGCRVLALGNLTVGGTGKSTIARWLALESLRAGTRPGVLLRGYGADDPGHAGVLPDFERYPLEARVSRYGDEAIALRRALPREAVVAVDPDRYRAGRAAADGHGARLLILDDGWEQDGLRWDELWVALDPRRPAGNGSLLPAGPLRRPVSSLREATRVVFVLEEEEEEVPVETIRWLGRAAPGVPTLRLLRRLLGVAPPGCREVEPLPRGARVALLSGVGSPERLTRFLRAVGAELTWHEAYPDHARWTIAALERSLRRAERAGADLVLITEKDEPRWPATLHPALPLRVIRTGASPRDTLPERDR